MEQIKLARLAVAAAPYLIDKPYTYTVPDAQEQILERGMRVLVPLWTGQPHFGSNGPFHRRRSKKTGTETDPLRIG